MKLVTKLMPVDPYDISGLEGWLTELAGKGLFFQRCGAFRAKFLVGPPAPYRYRLEPSQASPLDAEQKAYYAHCGWEHVGELWRCFQVFRTSDPEAEELHTDPVAQSYTLDLLTRKLKPAALLIGVCVLGILLMIAALYLLSDWPLLTAISNGASQFLLVVVELIVAGSTLLELRGILRLRRQLRSGIPMDHGPTRRLPYHLLFNIFAILLALLSICVTSRSLYARWQRPLAEVQGDIPFLSLASLEQAADYRPFTMSVKEGGQDINHRASYEWSPLAEHYESDQWGIVPSRISEDGDAYHCRLTLDYYDLTFPFLAAPLLDELVYRYTEHHYFPEEYTVEERTVPGLDRLVVAQDNDWPGMRLFAALDGKVVYLDYSGDVDLSAHLDKVIALLEP